MIDGYVNAVERESKVLRNRSGTFVEKIKAGAFGRALDRAKRTSSEVRVLLNHNYERELTSTRDAKTKIFEDAIGLRCQCEIRDAEVIQKARDKKLRGWSFGFTALRDNWTKGENEQNSHREVRELDLKEVSILDDTKIPAYDGTSIEMRDEDGEDLIEFRAFDEDVEVEDKTTPEERSFDNHEFENRYLSTFCG
jgi:hypothetical protein